MTLNVRPFKARPCSARWSDAMKQIGRDGTDIALLYKPQMSSAVLDGRKSQTRRLCKLPPAPNRLGSWEVTTVGGAGVFTSKGEPAPSQAAVWHTRTGTTICCPYGQPG